MNIILVALHAVVAKRDAELENICQINEMLKFFLIFIFIYFLFLIIKKFGFTT